MWAIREARSLGRELCNESLLIQPSSNFVTQVSIRHHILSMKNSTKSSSLIRTYESKFCQQAEIGSDGRNGR